MNDSIVRENPDRLRQVHSTDARSSHFQSGPSSRIAACMQLGRLITVWDTAAYGEGELMVANGVIHAIAFSPDSQTLTIRDEVWEHGVETWEPNRAPARFCLGV